MKCKICGSECPPGAKICRDCATARKRAFAATVTQPLLAGVGIPSVSAPRFAPKPVRARASVAPAVDREPRPEPTPALPLNVVPRRLGVHWLLIGVAIATTTVVLLVKMLSSGAGHATEDADAAAASAPPAPVVAAPAVSPPVAAEARIAQDASATMKSVNDVRPPKSAPDRAARKLPARPESAQTVVAPLPPAPEPAPVARAPVPPPRTVEAPRPDPWQVMNEALSRCAREDLFTRIACEQRLRLQYCPNYWGLVPQCPIGPATDHGQ
jgi:hypothetical protein